jgi:hypothetical protein
MLKTATDSLITAACDASATADDLNNSAKAFCQAAGRACLDEANAALAALGNHIELDDVTRGGTIAMVCGALVERGCDPSIVAQRLTSRIEPLLIASAELLRVCVEQIPKTDDEDHDRYESFEAAREQLAPSMPTQNAAWAALDKFWGPAIAALGASAAARQAARPLLDAATQISEFHQAGHWLRLMLTVLENEPVLVIEPNKSLGIVGRISGVVENFTLNTLLMDVFPRKGWFSRRRRIPQRVADVARGKGPQQTNDTVTSVWNLYTWRAIQRNLQLPNPKDYDAAKNWIWNEGTPADIPIFEGHRVILLGPRSYVRFWPSQRTFKTLATDLICERSLTPAEISEHLKRMLAAKDTN